MVSESIGPTTIYIYAPNPRVLDVKGCIGKNSNLTSDRYNFW